MSSFKLTEVKANLFHTPQSYSLANAVSADLKGLEVRGSLAWQMGIIFGQVDELRKQKIYTGSVAVLEDKSRFVYFLVTKKRIELMSTYDELQSALICMREHMRNHGVLKMAIPKICCGRDGLQWQNVREIIIMVFHKEYNVEILVCEHSQVEVPTTLKCQIIEVKGNIFTAPNHFSLVHSVSADFAMCQGIGLQFKCKFGQINELIKQNKHTGNVAVLLDNDRFIYNLVTKERNHEKCTYPALYYALVAMREHMIQNNVTKLAIPRLGCGIDRLSWLKVKNLLEFVFGTYDVEIIAFFYDPAIVKPGRLFVHSSSCKRSI